MKDGRLDISSLPLDAQEAILRSMMARGTFKVICDRMAAAMIAPETGEFFRHGVDLEFTQPTTDLKISVSPGKVRINSIWVMTDHPDAKILLIDTDTKNLPSPMTSRDDQDNLEALVGPEGWKLEDCSKITFIIGGGEWEFWSIEVCKYALYITIRKRQAPGVVLIYDGYGK
jgi:hypothetical protein